MHWVIEWTDQPSAAVSFETPADAQMTLDYIHHRDPLEGMYISYHPEEGCLVTHLYDGCEWYYKGSYLEFDEEEQSR